MKQDLHKIKNIIFDLDDTLVGSTAAYDRAMLSLRIDKDSDEYLNARKAAKAQLLPTTSAASKSRFIYFKTLLDQTQGRALPTELLALAGRYEELIVADLWQQWRELGREKLIEVLLQKGLRLFVLTNETLRLQTTKLSGFSPQLNWLSGYLTSEEVGCEKPDPKMFHTLMLKFNISPSETLMVGDSYVNDIEPALRLGMQALQSLEFLPSAKTHSHTIKSLAELSSF